MAKANPEFQKFPSNRKAWDSFWDRWEANKKKTKKSKGKKNDKTD